MNVIERSPCVGIRKGSRLIGDFLVVIEPAGEKIRRVLKKTNVLKSMKNGKS